MNSDNNKRQADAPWRPAGAGMAITQRCGKCNQPMPNHGRRKQLVRGASLYVGVCCRKVEAAK